MLFNNVFVAASALFSFASAIPLNGKSSLVVPRQAAVIKTALLAAEAEAIELRDAFAVATGADPAELDAIRAQGQVLLASVQNCEAVTAASPNLSLLDVLGFASTVTKLQATLDSALDVVIDKKPVVDSLGATQEVYDTMVTMKAAVNSFGTVLLTKVPASAKSVAQGYIDDFNASFDAVLAVYAPAA